jgi:hypothetical protein
MEIFHNKAPPLIREKKCWISKLFEEEADPALSSLHLTEHPSAMDDLFS